MNQMGSQQTIVRLINQCKNALASVYFITKNDNDSGAFPRPGPLFPSVELSCTYELIKSNSVQVIEGILIRKDSITPQ